MKLKLVRKMGTAGFTEGKLYINGVFECYTVEDADRMLEAGGKKIQDKTAIPRGTYEVVITMSNRFKKRLPLLLNVPGFTGIRIHAGNSSKNTEGCIIVGSINARDDDDWVGGSKVAMQRLMPKIEAALAAKEKVTMEVV
jgi:hypothetical protein